MFIYIDVNECNTANNCQQICDNTDGSYMCSCNMNYVLNADNRTCDGNDQNC